MMRSRRTIVFWGLAAIAAVLTLLLGCSSEPPKPLRVGSIPWPGYEALYLARDLGYYHDHPIQLVDQPSATVLSQAYRNNDLEIAALTLDETLLLATTQPDARIILVTDISNGADVILAKPGLRTVADLKGRKVGVEATALGAYVLTRALEQAQLSVQDVQIVSLGSSEHEQAFKDGTVDAVVTFEPARSKLLQTGARQVFDSTKIPGEIVDVLVVRQDVLEHQSKTVQALLEGWFKALDYMEQHPQDAARRVAPREGVSPEAFLASLKLLEIPNLAENRIMLSAKSKLHEDMQRLANVMQKNQLLKDSVDVNALLDDRVVRNLS